MIPKNGGMLISTRIRGGKFNDENYLGNVLNLNESINQPFTEMHTPENIEGFKEVIKNLIKTTENNDLGSALKIVNTLISHDKKEVVASSLGSLFVLIQDPSIREMIINELNEMKCDEKYSVRKSAEDSLDMITCDLNKYEILDYCYDILNHIFSKLDNYNYFKGHFQIKYHSLSKINSIIKSKIINSRFTGSWDNMLHNILKIMLVIDSDLNIFQMNTDEVDNYYENDLDKALTVPYEELSQMDNPDGSQFDRLATIYAITYRENGSISHLSGLLNDEDYKTRYMAVAGLCHALKGLAHFQPNCPDENLINQVFTQINPIQYENETRTGCTSK
jgi:hypothetical protein